MSILSKLALAAGTAASLTVAAVPASANPYDGYGYGYRGYSAPRHHDDTAAILAGALVIGGIAAIAASSSHHRDYDHGYYRPSYGGGYYGSGSAYGYGYGYGYESPARYPQPGYDGPGTYGGYPGYGYGGGRPCDHDGY